MAILGRIIKRALSLRQFFNPQRLDPINYQKQEFRTLLSKARHTEFGKTYRFSEILEMNNPLRQFQKNVPIHDYDSIYQQWWYRSLKGECDVTWPGKIDYFALSSGTSGAPNKYIPVSNDMVGAIQKAGIKQIYSLAAYNLPPQMFQKGVLILGGSTQLKQKDHYYEGDLSGISAANIPSWFQHFYKPGKEISAQKDWNTKLDEITRKAPEWDIGMICGIPAWVQILLEKIIQHHNLSSIHEIWPNLSVYVHGGVAFGPYKRALNRLMARPLVNIETYIASEGYIAFQQKPNADMSLLLNNGIFYEFIPFDDANFDQDGMPVSNPEVLTIEDVEVGQQYALLVSTCAGCWRYLLGDVIQFTNIRESQIIITGRTKHFLSLCGEHLSVNNMVEAIQMLEDQFDMSIPEFTTAGISKDSRFAHKWYLGGYDFEHINQERLMTQLDANLKQVNNDYDIKRGGPLKEPDVEILPVSLFYEWMENRGKMGGQNKFPRVLNKNQLPDWEQFITAKGYETKATGVS